MRRFDQDEMVTDIGRPAISCPPALPAGAAGFLPPSRSPSASPGRSWPSRLTGAFWPSLGGRSGTRTGLAKPATTGVEARPWPRRSSGSAGSCRAKPGGSGASAAHRPDLGRVRSQPRDVPPIRAGRRRPRQLLHPEPLLLETPAGRGPRRRRSPRDRCVWPRHDATSARSARVAWVLPAIRR